METIETERMRLTAGTAGLLRREAEGRAALGRALVADVPPSWPPETIRDAMPWFAAQLASDPGLTGWLCWYGIVRGAGAGSDTLIASGGFLGPPTDGSVEIGYSVLPEYERRGYAGEMAAGLTAWALRQPGVARVTAEADAQNTPSVRLLRRLGFIETGPGREPGHLRFERLGLAAPTAGDTVP